MENYRSTPEVLEAAAPVIEKNPGGCRRLRPNRPSGPAVRMVRSPDAFSEGGVSRQGDRPYDRRVDMLEAQALGHERTVRAFLTSPSSAAPIGSWSWWRSACVTTTSPVWSAGGRTFWRTARCGEYWLSSAPSKARRTLQPWRPRWAFCGTVPPTWPEGPAASGHRGQTWRP